MTINLLKDPLHPGEVLHELYLKPLGMSAPACARRLGVPRSRIERLVKGTTAMTPDTAFRLAYLFDTSPVYWMNMQTNYSMSKAAGSIDISAIKPLVPA
ncbi:MAG: HigA family addiction module antitoxin [Rhodobacteraceae bacterium]|nr:HigA family addiction module antitoxin [Paracoccaceae bacterium]